MPASVPTSVKSLVCTCPARCTRTKSSLSDILAGCHLDNRNAADVYLKPGRCHVEPAPPLVIAVGDTAEGFEVIPRRWVAGANGSEFGRDYREKIEWKMTPADISEAQKRARICMASNYTDCGRSGRSLQGSTRRADE